MVRHAFEVLTEGKRKTRLICFSDDMDGFRKVPGNVPKQEMLAQYIDMPLTRVPDPFGGIDGEPEYESFAHHNNARLRRFLDQFGFEYEFYSATEFYKSGQFDEILLRCAERYDDLMKIMLKSLREERQQTYSIFLPIHPETGRVLYVPMKHVDAAEATAGARNELPEPAGEHYVETFGLFLGKLGADVSFIRQYGIMVVVGCSGSNTFERAAKVTHKTCVFQE